MVDLVNEGVMYVPEVGLAPVHPPEAVQEVAFVEDRLIVPVPPYTIGDWATVIVTVGFDVAANEIFPHSIIMENSIKLSIFCVFIVLTL